MKRYSLIPQDTSPTLEGIADEVEAGGKLVLPMVNGIYTLAVENISAEDARLFLQAQASQQPGVAGENPPSAPSEGP